MTGLCTPLNINGVAYVFIPTGGPYGCQDMASHLQEAVRDAAGGWAAGGNRPYSHGQLDVGELKSLQLFHEKKTRRPALDPT